MHGRLSEWINLAEAKEVKTYPNIISWNKIYLN